MDQRHPLEDPSLAPFGFAFPLQQERITLEEPSGIYWVNEERMIAQQWDEWNRLSSPWPRPIEMIIHHILPSIGKRYRITDSSFIFNGRPYNTRDILILSSTMTWLGTNCGKCFIDTDISREDVPGFHPAREFHLKLAREAQIQRVDMYAVLCHSCKPTCNRRARWPHCHIDPREVSERDRIIIDSLMRWLGRGEGRSFISIHKENVRKALEAKRSRITKPEKIVA